MSTYTKEDILRICEEEDVEFIRLQFTDMFGSLKNMAITKSQLSRALDNSVMFDGSAIDGFVGVDESDMVLHPNCDTFAILPWRPQRGKVGRMYCDIYRPDGTPFMGDSRQVLKKVIEEAKSLGYSFQVGPECEFFLFDTDENGAPTVSTKEQAGYFDVGPLDSGENARRDIVMNMEEMGYVVDASHHEKTCGQHEVDLEYDDALRTADKIMTFKLVTRTIAKRHGLHATFMPKPNENVNGSAMHINMSLSKDGRNIFRDDSDKNGLSDEAYYFLGGILKHIKAIAAVSNPLVNSYKRLVPGFDAPVYIAWSTTNRSALVRIPSVRNAEHTRIELRSADSCANPYLLLALLLGAGLEGIRNKILPPESVSGNIFDMTDEARKKAGIDRLPGNLMEALEELKKDELIMGILGEHVGSRYITAKQDEWTRYLNHVTRWELTEYLNKY
ncbi:MAG: type I glutamate--ammonia ligase [Lachnospiraceae bacterium]|nr:type I glutamate--ammonia ligase [Lachnospiraceae bacterium]